jgi:hypothetical protein
VLDSVARRILRNGAEQKSKNDPQNLQTALIGKKAGQEDQAGRPRAGAKPCRGNEWPEPSSTPSLSKVITLKISEKIAERLSKREVTVDNFVAAQSLQTQQVLTIFNRTLITA